MWPTEDDASITTIVEAQDNFLIKRQKIWRECINDLPENGLGHLTRWLHWGQSSLSLGPLRWHRWHCDEGVCEVGGSPGAGHWKCVRPLPAFPPPPPSTLCYLFNCGKWGFPTLSIPFWDFDLKCILLLKFGQEFLGWKYTEILI